MSECRQAYAFVQGENISGPFSMMSVFNGIKGWNKLTDEERAAYGWVKAFVYGEHTLPGCVLLGPKHSINPDGSVNFNFSSRYKTQDEMRAEYIEFVGIIHKQTLCNPPSYKGIQANKHVIDTLPNICVFEFLENIDFNINSDWFSLSLEDVEVITKLYNLHVQACFSSKLHLLDSLSKEVSVNTDVEAQYRSKYISIMSKIQKYSEVCI